MKIKNFFKKETKTVAKTNVEKLEKNQLEKVVGGADGINTTNGGMPNRISMNVTTSK